MICPECNGKGEVKYYREIDRDENRVTVEGHLDVCHTCHGSGKKPMTNADHIRSMTDEELAETIVREFCAVSDNTIEFIVAKTRFRLWLKQPYKEDA